MHKKEDYRVIIDQSTSGTKLLLVSINEEGVPLIKKRIDRSHKQIYPQKGWVEHDPLEILENVKSLFSQLLDETVLQKEDIKSISLTNQRETIILWDKNTGKPLHNAMVWQCNRSLDICKQLINRGKEAIVQKKTGLKIDTYFSAPKLSWLFQSFPAIRQDQNLAVGTMDSWLIWNLTNRKIFATDSSNASRTLLYNIHTESWDKELCELFDTPIESLPEVYSSDSQFGSFEGIPIVGVIADSQGALYGQGLTEKGDVKATLGTGCSVLMQIESDLDSGNETILKTIGWKTHNKTSYALEGIIRSCTDTLNWMSNELGLFETVSEGSEKAFSIPDSDGVYIVPAQLGLGAPFWEPEPNGAILGLGRNSTKNHIIRAGFDTIVYQIKAVIDVMEVTSQIEVKKINVDGGAIKNNHLMQLLADVLQKNIVLNTKEEMSALGALNLAVKLKTENEKPTIFYPTTDKSNDYKQWFDVVNKYL
ncbi:FGGY-family carbohydrate kinase [Marinilactibacillus psychrotolerans]|uniref:Glycerol kinase n=1 Tax=Marinilactibacillus psychrotolerans TaxID=191770 RepID=A0AAV3WQY4_9LACT|nr:FGGY family carbohydrate kinase [Marinilactibacillus psychrotolerans]GEL65931.1 glycerol kinase [Marinilactibacillus psychrotolerans]GEQ34793.1 glycerol kinase [Marinilactibacillus psychrotolerans]SDC11162.1 glycerol kinase [Marinilactibacillus psychrotolerans]